MKALVFRYSLPRLAAARLLGALSPAAYFGPWAPLRLENIPIPALPAHDWLLVRTVRCGIYGSDAKQAFLRGDRDNPLTAPVLQGDLDGGVQRLRGGDLRGAPPPRHGGLLRTPQTGPRCGSQRYPPLLAGPPSRGLPCRAPQGKDGRREGRLYLRRRCPAGGTIARLHHGYD